MYFRTENMEKPKEFHQKLHAEITIRWAGAIIEQALAIPFSKIQSPTRRAEIVDARTLYIGMCVALGVRAVDVARSINRTEPPMIYHLKRFDALLKVKSEQKFRDKFLKIINLQKQKMSETIQKDGKTYVSADVLEKVIQDTLSAMGVPTMLDELKAAAGKELKKTAEQEQEIQHETAISNFIKSQSEQPLGGKEI